MGVYMSKRTDTHRPSVIDPTEYEFVAYDYIGPASERSDGVFEDERARLMDHRQAHEYAGREDHVTHANAGCAVCGSHPFTVGWFYHPSTRKYVMIGHTCADKLHMGNPAHFRNLRRALKAEREFAAGRQKAERILSEAGLARVWELFTTDHSAGYPGNEERTIDDMVGKLVRYGALSERQIGYFRTLLGRIDTRPEREARYAAEREAAADCPEGKVEIVGTVVKIATQENAYGVREVWTVKDDRGFLVWGTIPTIALDEVEGKGDRVQFVATITRSDRDEKFGFAKRPRNAEVLSVAWKPNREG